MFTIKNVMDDGHEDIFEVESVEYVPADKAAMTSDTQYDRVLIKTEKNGSLLALTYGMVYVMNSNGKTVSTYHLMISPSRNLSEAGKLVFRNSGAMGNVSTTGQVA